MDNTRTSFNDVAGNQLRKAVAPLVHALARAGVTPNQLTVASCILSTAAAAFIIVDLWVPAAVIFAVGGLLDVLDGALARSIRATTPGGALLDSVLDRVSDGALFFALALYYFNGGLVGPGVLALLAWMGAYLTSYVRARGHALGADFAGGLATRAHRIAILALGLLLENWIAGLMPWALALLAVLGLATAAYRLVKTTDALNTGANGDMAKK